VESLRGQLLISSPGIVDPNFRRTVVLLCEHGEEGAMGVVLNRPSETEVADALPDLAGVVDAGEPVYVGGPVQQDAVLVLAEFADPEAAAELVVGDVGFARGDGDFDALEAAARRARVFVGYAGWGAGQLESELKELSWLVEPAAGVDLFRPPADDLFAAVLRPKGGAYGVLALMPDDPALN
jgi:putative transcriptional regulator